MCGVCSKSFADVGIRWNQSGNFSGILLKLFQLYYIVCILRKFNLLIEKNCEIHFKICIFSKLVLSDSLVLSDVLIESRKLVYLIQN